MLFSLELMTSLGGGGGGGESWGEAWHWDPSAELSPLLGQVTGHSPPACTQAKASDQRSHPFPPPGLLRVTLSEGWVSPTELAPPSLVGVKEAFTKEQSMQGHIL